MGVSNGAGFTAPFTQTLWHKSWPWRCPLVNPHVALATVDYACLNCGFHVLLAQNAANVPWGSRPTPPHVNPCSVPMLIGRARDETNWFRTSCVRNPKRNVWQLSVQFRTFVHEIPYEIVFRGQSYINVSVVQIYAFAVLYRVYHVAI